VKTSAIISAWRKILKGERPSLSIEITRECPLLLARTRFLEQFFREALLYPCQSIYSTSSTLGLFRSVPCPDPKDQSRVDTVLGRS
jgi:hypothetical protein